MLTLKIFVKYLKNIYISSLSRLRKLQHALIQNITKLKQRLYAPLLSMNIRQIIRHAFTFLYYQTSTKLYYRRKLYATQTRSVQNTAEMYTNTCLKSELVQFFVGDECGEG